MRTKAVGFPLVFCLLGACLVLAIWIDAAAKGGQGQDDATPAADAAESVQPPQDATFVGALDCATCHLEVELKYRNRTNFIHFTEFVPWITEDKHARSLLRIIPEKKLHTDKSKAFGELLTAIKDDIPEGAGEVVSETWGASNELAANILKKFDPEKYGAIDLTTFEAAEDVSAAFLSEKRCLSCHANFRAQDEKLDNDALEYAVGVGCESCHGAASGWRDKHQDLEWRTMKPSDKWSQHGMVDVRSPAARANQCNSCHVGNPDEGKVVTHEMFAAGHPPLPGIEIETFANQMPRHWRYLEEKPGDFENRAAFEQAHTTWKAGDLSSSKAVVLGGVAAMRDFLELLSAQAADSKTDWPQFAMYDCSSCHHDLQASSVRQEVGFGNRRPGRPMVHQWPQALVEIAVAQAGGDGKEYADKVQALNEVLNAVPFGDRAALSAENNPAQQLAEYLTTLVHAVEAKPFDAAAANEALKMLCNSSLADVVDYHSARQIAWAIRVLYGDVADSLGEAKPVFDATLAEIDEMLELDLPAGSAGDISKNLPEALQRIMKYDPRAFHAKLQQLAAALN